MRGPPVLGCPCSKEMQLSCAATGKVESGGTLKQRLKPLAWASRLCMDKEGTGEEEGGFRHWVAEDLVRIKKFKRF